MIDSSLLNAKHLKVLNLGDYADSAMHDMTEYFVGCDTLEYIAFTGIDTSCVDSMEGMCRGCKSLKMVNLRGIDLTNTRNLSYMFEDCAALEVLDFSGVNIDVDADLRKMFKGCDSLREIALEGCDRVTVNKIVHEYYETYERLISFKTCREPLSELSLLCRCCGVSALPFEKGDWGTYFKGYGRVYAYSTECYCKMEYEDAFVEGEELVIRVFYPVYCKVGDCFSVATRVPGDSGETIYNYSTLQLLEIIVQLYSEAFVRVKVVKNGTYMDFVQPNSPVPDSYKHCDFGPLDATTVYDINKEVGVLVLGAQAGDLWQDNHIVTVNGIDHLAIIEFTYWHDDIVVFGDYVLGYHHQSPYTNDK